jgi:hypothetical protein
LIPKKINENKLLWSKRDLHLSELSGNELLEFAACEIQFDSDFLG